MSDDLAHDAHLRAALRHAPDHALAPPSGVSQNILAAARHAHRPARPVSPAPPVRVTVAPPRYMSMLLRLLASPRWAGGLATGLMVALGIGLWLDIGAPPAIDRPGEPAPPADERIAQAPASPPADTTATSQVPAQPDTATTLLREAPSVPTPTAAPPEGAPAPPPNAAAAKAESGRRAADRGTIARNEAPKSKSASPQSANEPGAEPAAPAAQAPPVAQAPLQKQTAPSATNSASATGTIATEAPRPAAPARADTERSQGMRSRTIEKALARAPQETGTTSLGASGLASSGVAPAAAASPALALLRRIRAEQSSGAAGWAWQPPGFPAAPAPHDDAAQAWLLRVVQTARGRWLDVSESSGPGDALEIRWWRDGWPQATLRIEPEGLRWIEASGRVRYAPLDAAALQRLRSP